MKREELIKIMMIFTFFTIFLCQFSQGQGLNDYMDGDIFSCDKCPYKLCNKLTGVCNDSESQCIGEDFFGESCNISCSNLGSCSKCYRNGSKCLECQNNESWGEHCEIICEKCPNKKCMIEDGKCIEDAEYCPDPSYHGEYCSDKCSEKHEHCLKCLKVDGNCTECEKPFYNFNCGLECEFCPSQECFINGNCTDPRADCEEGERKGVKCDKTCNEETSSQCQKCHRNGTCSQCQTNKFWGYSCTKPCSHCPDQDDSCNIFGKCNNTKDNCHDNLTYDDCFTLCNKSHPNCLTCDRGGNCLSCLNRKTYGVDCEESCKNCPDGDCNFDGTCIDQIKNCSNTLYTGPSCNESCSKISEFCHTCDRNRKCLNCTTQSYFGDNCEKECICPEKKCEINGICVIYEGKCFDDSYYGEKCDRKCNETRPNCVNCDIFGECSKCINDNYFGYNCSRFCEKCPENRCLINGTCIITNETCPDPQFYGPDCNTRCDVNNTNCNTCLMNGTCISCKSEFFWGPECNNTCKSCPDEKCHNNGICTDLTKDCVNNTDYGEKCDIPCSEINANCKLCNRNEKCLECVNHTMFGDTCNKSCEQCPKNSTDEDELCDINGICYNKTGLCTNISFTGEGCSDLCYTVHENCKTCNRSGICFECINQTKFGPYCNKSCEYCPKNNSVEDELCDINGKCYNETGLCTNISFTGEGCSDLCSDVHENCKTCNRSGICFECIDKTKYGPYCNESCERCPDVKEFAPLNDNEEEKDLCYINGTCKNLNDVCRNKSFTGETCNDLCSIKYENCKECDRENICTECNIKNQYGDFCNISCENCPDGLCNITGICQIQDKPCENKSLTGEYCNLTCSSIYNRSYCTECDRNYECTKCINETIFGVNCTKKCDNCPGEPRLCNITGDCLNQKSLCIDSNYTGSKCDELCIKTVNDNCKICDREKNCLECVNKTKFGNKCQVLCDNCPGESKETRYCHNNGTCFEQEKLCINDTKYGPDCNTNCSNISDFCKTCNREGKCTACTDKKHSGDKCKEQCDQCSEEGCNIKGYCKEFKCPNESYGLECDQKCQCGSNSNDGTCGKFRGQCSRCKFGYFGKKCDLRCNYKCQTELCCLFNEHKDENMTILKIETNYKTIEIIINAKPYTFEIDYNYGFPLTIFNNKTELINCDNDKIKTIDYQNVSSKEEYHEKFTNFDITSYLNNGQKITINGNVDITTDIAVALKAKCLSIEGMKEKISGVIGFGFFNSISNAIFTNSTLEDYKLNILSFDYKAEGDKIEMLFGDLFEIQRRYVERLTSCKVILNEKSDIQEKKMTCQLDGIKVSKYSEAFKLNNSYITFSLGEKTSLILGNNSNYFEYLKLGFFDDENLKPIDDKESDGIQYIVYPNNKINKLSDFGFVFNNFAYSYPPNKFFVNTSNSNNEEGESQFLIKINKKTDRTEFIIGREFFNDIKFTINNEEAQIYFYAQNAQYTDKFTDVINDSLFKIKLNSRATAGICLAIIIFIYLIAFTIYYFVKRKKMKSGDYIRIE